VSRSYFVNDLYWAIQGEGVLAGTPMVLLRLHGCPVACRFCDTKETWAFREADRRETLAEALGQNGHWASVPLEDIVAAVKQEAIGGTSWVLITGGEPATQQLRPLVAALHGAGFAVALETSGTREGHLQPKGEPEDDGGADHVTVSPKLGNPGRQPILRRVVAAADELKFILSEASDLERIDAFLWSMNLDPAPRISLQPESCSPQATALALAECRRRGWHLSLQSHKFIGAR